MPCFLPRMASSQRYSVSAFTHVARSCTIMASTTSFVIGCTCSAAKVMISPRVEAVATRRTTSK